MLGPYLYYTASTMPIAVQQHHLAYVHDALGYIHYAMQFPHTFGLTCFVGTITLWIIDACMLLMGKLNQLQTEQTALSLSDK